MRYSSVFRYLLYVVLATYCTSCSEPLPPTDLTKSALIPHPVRVTATQESFVLTPSTAPIHLLASAKDWVGTAGYLAETLLTHTGISLSVENGPRSPGYGGVYFDQRPLDSLDLGEEGYVLQIAPQRIIIQAEQEAGAFRAVQTLRQLLPVVPTDTVLTDWIIPTGTIIDYPKYAYRGAMLDVSRHFFDVAQVKHYLDLLALYKINHLHLHLADDQGWRMEIKSWPRLTTHGGSTAVGGGEGGFYTQADYQEIVQYAASRFITIVPEIDMPGHTNAALSSYAVLNCDGVAPDLYTGTKVGFSTLCTRKDTVYAFVDDVVREISALTPGPYFHLGGDESHVTPLADYVPFIERAQAIINKYGKQMMGWEEVTNAQLSAGSVVQYWREAENMQRGLRQGAQVLLSPAQYAYLDMQYDSTTELGLHWAAYVEVDSAYLWTPEALVPGRSESQILGIESPLWTETITNLDELEYLAFPRVIGHAELGWSPTEGRNWDDYRRRLGAQGPLLRQLGVNFYASSLVEWGE
ncbi:MAG: beta-N-acetylhexosaminidase [Bacteroidota bacterium]